MDRKVTCPWSVCAARAHAPAVAANPDALGHVDKPHVSYDPARSFQMRSYGIVGGYAFQPTWGDGHSTGLYAFPLLRSLGQPENLPQPA